MKIGIVGCAGRMGRMLLGEVIAQDGLVLSGGTESPGHENLSDDLGVLAGVASQGIIAGDDTSALFDASDVVIDFTVPATTQTHAALAAKHQTALVIGTTGLSAEDQAAVETAAQKVAVVQAANMSVGVNVLLGLAEPLLKMARIRLNAVTCSGSGLPLTSRARRQSILPITAASKKKLEKSWVF